MTNYEKAMIAAATGQLALLHVLVDKLCPEHRKDVAEAVQEVFTTVRECTNPSPV